MCGCGILDSGILRACWGFPGFGEAAAALRRSQKYRHRRPPRLALLTDSVILG